MSKVTQLKRSRTAAELDTPTDSDLRHDRRDRRAHPQDRRHHAALDRPHLPGAIDQRDEAFVTAGEMVRELMNDNKKAAAAMRKAHKLCDDHEDVATASLLENYIDATEKRTWFLFESARAADESGH